MPSSIEYFNGRAIDPSHSLELTRWAGHISGAPWSLIDAKTNESTGYQVTGKPQHLRCGFCRKNIASWCKQKSNRSNSTSVPMPAVGEAAMSKHAYGQCAIDYLASALCHWSIGILDPVRDKLAYEAINSKIRRMGRFLDNPPARFLDNGYRIEDTIEWFFFNKILHILPQRPDSEMALHLEIGLIGLSRLFGAD